jgi:hypothetical protein
MEKAGSCGTGRAPAWGGDYFSLLRRAMNGLGPPGW